MLLDFVLLAIIAGCGVAVVCGVLGCFVVWRRMAYFGDALAHSAFLGIAIGILAQTNIHISIFLVCIVIACLFLWLLQRRLLAADTLLGILAHASLAAGILLISQTESKSFALFGYLFGDILTVAITDIIIIYSGGALALLLLIIFWSQLLLTTLNPAIAKSEGVNTFFIELLLLVLMATVVAISIRIVGVFLITSMLIIPAACARQLTSSATMMAITAVVIAIFAVMLGITASIYFDVPSGPSIVASLALIFAFGFALRRVY